MSHKGQTTSQEERVMIAERIDAGQSSRELAEELKRPQVTVRKWRRRHLRESKAGFARQISRPAVGALAAQPVEMKGGLLALREKHPSWGA
jgi:transposase-like protein